MDFLEFPVHREPTEFLDQQENPEETAFQEPRAWMDLLASEECLEKMGVQESMANVVSQERWDSLDCLVFQDCLVNQDMHYPEWLE